MIVPGREPDVMAAIADLAVAGRRVYPLAFRAGIRIRSVQPLREVVLNLGVTIRLRPADGGTDVTVSPRVLSPLLLVLRRSMRARVPAARP